MIGERAPGFATRSIHAGAPAAAHEAIEQRVALLEGGTAAVAVAAGAPLLMVALRPLLRPGDQMIVSRQFALADATVEMASAFGWDVRSADVDDHGAFERLVTPKTQAILVAGVADSGEVADLAAFAAIAKRAQVPLVVDNTLPTPALCAPFEFGAEIVFHRDTRFLAAQAGGTGFIVDGGQFNWTASSRYPALVGHATNGSGQAGEVGNFAYAAACRQIVGEGGPVADVASIAAGLETLPLRMARHAENARAVAEFLAANPQVASVTHAGLPGDRHHMLAERYCAAGPGAIVGFAVENGEEDGARFLQRLVLIGTGRELRAARSSIARVAGRNGGDGTMRLSVGLEDVADIIDDLRQALAGD